MFWWLRRSHVIGLVLLGTLCYGASPRRTVRSLSSPEIQSLVDARDPLMNLDPSEPSSHLAKILIPRPPDTANNTLVKNYLASTLRALNWEVEEDEFEDMTPYGMKKFTNVIATKDPRAARRVILAAHFDSKFFPAFPQSQFLGATDSAAPCAILLDLAEVLNPLLDSRATIVAGSEDSEFADTTIQLVFFDGEEAFKDWTHTDSIYGARHLAVKWAKTFIDPFQKRRLHPTATELSTIDHLILLDLLGAAGPKIRSYFLPTAWLFDSLVNAERRIVDSGALSEEGLQAWNAGMSFFIKRTGTEMYPGGIEDDHLPFLHLGVNILHIIPAPFPRVWHTLRDDGSALDLPALKRWNLIFRVFVAEYLDLRPAVPSPIAASGRGNGDL